MFMELLDASYSRYCVESVFEVDREGCDLEGLLFEGVLKVMEDDLTPPRYAHAILVR
jgi:hypothetical protein